MELILSSILTKMHILDIVLDCARNAAMETSRGTKRPFDNKWQMAN
jgi:hypothetical protein